MRITKKRSMGILLSFVMVLGLMPCMSLTAYADTWEGNPYSSFENTTNAVKFNEIAWYIIKDESTAVNAGTVTLLAKDPIDASTFNNPTSDGNRYSGSGVKKYLDKLTATGGSFAGVAEAIEPVTLTINYYNSTTVAETIQDAKLWLLSTSEAQGLPVNVRKCSQASGADDNFWWLRSPGSDVYRAACVNGGDGYVGECGIFVRQELGVRPALKLNLSSVIFESESKTFLLKNDVTGISLDKESITPNVGGTETLKVVSFTPSDTTTNATDKTVTWSSSDTAVATVDNTGKVTAVAAGTATITTTATNGTDDTTDDKTASCEVTVKSQDDTPTQIW